MNHRVFVVLLLSAFTPTTWAADDWFQQLNDALQHTLGQQVVAMAQQMSLPDYRYEVDLHYLDSRLNLPLCQPSLVITPPTPLKLGRNHIKVSCPHGRPWALNVPVDIKLFAAVVVLNQPIGRGQLLKAAHLDYQPHNLASLRNGYYLKKELVIGKQSKRSLAGRTVINGHLILPALMVHKGDQVMIEASKGAMSVKMPGEALSDGREGRQIRVKNSRSARIIKAVVIAPGMVRVLF
ncbi:MAG: flagellar basal body P-ring formation chaperone FlgA [Bermanella sp.]